MAISSLRRTALVLTTASVAAAGVWFLTLGATADAPAEAASAAAAPATAPPAPAALAAAPAATPVAAQSTRPAGPPAKGATSSFPSQWFYPDRRTGGRYAHHKAMEGKPAPKFTLHNWIGEPVEFEDTKGKIVVLDFWATWCRPCMRTVPKNVKMVEKNKDKGLVFIGIHDNRRGVDRMAAAVKANRMNYPVAVDKDGLSQRTYRVSFWPTYTVIDHHGVVRAAGVIPQYVEMVVNQLMKERDKEKGIG